MSGAPSTPFPSVLADALFVIAAVGACGCLLFVTFPPLVDYPQHVAMASELYRTISGEHGPRFVPFTYNGLFETSTALLAFLLPLETAARVVLATTMLVECSGVFLLVKRTGRPGAYAFLWFMGMFSFPFSWGFLDFCLSLGLATHVLAEWLGRRRGGVLSVLALLAVHAHILGFGLMVIALGAILASGGRRSRTGALRPLVAFLPALAWATASQLSCDPIDRLPREFLWIKTPLGEKIRHLQDNVFGSLAGPWDERLLVTTTLVIALLLLGSAATLRRTTWGARGIGAASAACTLLYFTLPYCIRGNWYIFHRPAAAAWLWLPAILPMPERRLGARAFESCAVVLGILGAGHFSWKMLTQPERTNAGAIIDAVPLRARVIPVFFSWDTRPSVDGYAYVHHVAYTITRRQALVPAMFSRRFGTFPVRDRWGPDAQLPDVGFEWARSFDPDADYARYFDTVLVRTPDDAPVEDPTGRVFGTSARRAERLSHFGRFWLYRLKPSP